MADITTDLEYHLPMNDDAASTAVVPSVDGNAFGNSTLVGANSADINGIDLSGNPYFVFDGADYITLPDFSGSITPDAEISVSYWAKYDVATPVAADKVFHMGLTGANRDNLMPWTDGLAYMSVFRANPSDNGVNSISLPAGIDRTEWVLYTITQIPGTGGWKFYMNNTLVHTEDGLANVTWTGTTEWFFGRGRTGTTDRYKGQARDFRLWTRNLAAADVECLFLASIVGENSAPIQHPFNFSNFE